MGLGVAAQPGDLAGDFVFQHLLVLLLGRKGGVTIDQEIAVATDGPKHAVGKARVDLDHAVGHGFEEPAVVADRDQGKGGIRQHAFQPQDAFEVQMVGWLVQQQDLGLLDQGGDNRQPLLPAARQATDQGVLISKSGLGQGHPGGHFGLVGVVAAGHQGGGGHAPGRGLEVELLLLGDIGHGQPPADGSAAGIRLFQTGQNLEERRLAGPVGAH